MRDVVISTPRLLLVAPEMEDCDALISFWQDPETMQHIGAGGTWDLDAYRDRIERAVRMHNEHGMTFWTVIEKASGDIIGQGGLVPIEFDGPEIELGYRLGKPYWGKGYATEIAQASAAHAFDSLGVDELVAVCYEENLASRAVLSKAGFVEAGLSDVYYGVTLIVHRMMRESCESIR